MKKYLFNGAMALIVGAFIVSCSHDDIGQISTVDEMTKSFDEMFKELYGPIAPNHNWGFETIAAEPEEDEATDEQAATRSTEKAGTRAINVNGNMWETCPTVDNPDEVNAIFDYVKYTTDQLRTMGHKFSQKAPKNINGYFVTQVRNGNNDDNKYHGFNNQGNVTAGEKMNFLQIAMKPVSGLPSSKEDSDWAHINNFNASSNANYGGNTLVENAGAYDFAYHNSLDSKFHNKWILVDGADITSDGKYGDYLYVCFDFESYFDNTNTKMKFKVPVGEANPNDWTEKMGEIPGAWTYDEAVAQHKTVTVDGITYTIGGTGTKDWDFYQVQEGDKWIPGNNIYTDWIIRITKGAPEEIPYKTESKKIVTKTYKRIEDLGRVFCEDIATASRYIKEDIDYNDIVFDARVWKFYDIVETTINDVTTTSGEKNKKYQYDICMLAAGGTIPENVGKNYVDVHDAFGVGLTFMVNTWTEKSTAFGQYNTPTNVMYPTKKFEIISYTLSYNDLPDENNIGIGSIPIYVKYNGQNVMALDDRKGKAPYKLCVPIGTLWPIERVNIKNAYLDFDSYVNSPNNKFYDGRKGEKMLYDYAPTSKIQDEFDKGWNKNHAPVLVSTKEESSTVIVLWDKPVTESNTAIKLYNYPYLGIGKTLRFYGKGTITVSGKDNQQLFNVPMSGGFKDIPISSNNQASKLKEGIIITSSGSFELTKIIVL